MGNIIESLLVFTKVNGYNNLYEAISNSGDILLAGDLIDNIK